MPTPLTQSVQKAIDQIKKAFAAHVVDIDEDDSGGAFVRVNGLWFGPSFVPNVGWVTFHVVYNTPHADVYPHYLPELKRVDEKPLVPPFHSKEMKLGKFAGSAAMVSRRSTRWVAAHDTAALKLLKVLEWIRSQ